MISVAAPVCVEFNNDKKEGSKNTVKLLAENKGTYCKTDAASGHSPNVASQMSNVFDQGFQIREAPTQTGAVK